MSLGKEKKERVKAEENRAFLSNCFFPAGIFPLTICPRAFYSFCISLFHLLTFHGTNLTQLKLIAKQLFLNFFYKVVSDCCEYLRHIATNGV